MRERVKEREREIGKETSNIVPDKEHCSKREHTQAANRASASDYMTNTLLSGLYN